MTKCLVDAGVNVNAVGAWGETLWKRFLHSEFKAEVEPQLMWLFWIMEQILI
jgi:hypothetical protein